MTPIRPSVLPAAQPAAQRSEAARLDAQKAFFDAALGRSGAAAAPGAPIAAPVSQLAPQPQRTPQASGDSPGTILRPGSLLDIRV